VLPLFLLSLTSAHKSQQQALGQVMGNHLLAAPFIHLPVCSWEVWIS